jgi:hypothetical protein
MRTNEEIAEPALARNEFNLFLTDVAVTLVVEFKPRCHFTFQISQDRLPTLH